MNLSDPLPRVHAAIPSSVPSLTTMFEDLLCAEPVGMWGGLGWAGDGGGGRSRVWVLAKRIQENGSQELYREALGIL